MARINVHDITEEHAKLSASGSGKWLICTPSAALEATIPDEDTDYSREGTFAHKLFELRLNNWLGRVKLKPRQSLAALEKKIKSHDEFYNAELSDHVNDAVEAAKELIVFARERCSDVAVFVEQRLDFSPWVPEGFGTGDLVIVGDGVVEVADLKYGKGVLVKAKGNSQARLYGLGAWNELGHLYDITSVRNHILQPRLDNYGHEEMPVEDLLAWAHDYVKPRAAAAWNGEGEFVPGEHCSDYFCRARFTCSARANKGLELAKEKFVALPPEQLTDDQVVSVLQRAKEVEKWLSDLQTYALKQAEAGKEWPGLKLVEGRSNRRYVDEEQVAEKLTKEGIKEAVIYSRSLLGITAMEKAIGKKEFERILADLIEKPQGKPVLVSQSDPRPPINSGAKHFEVLE